MSKYTVYLRKPAVFNPNFGVQQNAEVPQTVEADSFMNEAGFMTFYDSSDNKVAAYSVSEVTRVERVKE